MEEGAEAFAQKMVERATVLAPRLKAFPKLFFDHQLPGFLGMSRKEVDRRIAAGDFAKLDSDTDEIPVWRARDLRAWRRWQQRR